VYAINELTDSDFKMAQKILQVLNSYEGSREYLFILGNTARPSLNIIDGDLLLSFLQLPPDEQQNIILKLNNDKNVQTFIEEINQSMF